MAKAHATACIKVRTCNYQQILDDVLVTHPCDRWIKFWAESNGEWVYGVDHNLQARQFVDERIGAAQQQALDAYNTCLAGNPVDVSTTKGVALRVGTHLAQGRSSVTAPSDDKGLKQRLSVNFGGEVGENPECPPVSEAIFLRDDYDFTRFGPQVVDANGQRNYRFEIERDFRGDWAGSVCAEYDDYLCFYGAPSETNLLEVRLKISRLYELIRTVTQENQPPANVTVTPYDVSSDQTSDLFMTWQGWITQSPLLANFVFEYANAETGELVWQYPNSNGSDFLEGWFPLSPDNPVGSGTGAKSEPWWGLGLATPPRWGNWTVRCICLAVRMRLESFPEGIPIRHPDLLMARYPQPGGGIGSQPHWKITSGMTVYTPGMSDGLAKFECQNLKIVYHNHSYRCQVHHVKVVEGIGYLYNITFINDTKFDLWYAYRVAHITYYRADGTYFWGPSGNYPLMFHLPPFSTQTFWVLQPLEGYWLDRNVVGGVSAPTPWMNPYSNTVQLMGFAYPVKPSLAESLWTEVRDGDAGRRKAMTNYLNDAHLVSHWYACSIYPPASVVASPTAVAVACVEPGISGQRLGSSHSLTADVVFRNSDGKTYSSTQYFGWNQLSTALGLPEATRIEIPLDGTGYMLVRTIPGSDGYCNHALINQCDYWSSWEHFKARVDLAVRGLLPSQWTVLSLDLHNPYLGFDLASAPLSDPGWGARSGIVPSVSETGYPSRITVRI